MWGPQRKKNWFPLWQLGWVANSRIQQLLYTVLHTRAPTVLFRKSVIVNTVIQLTHKKKNCYGASQAFQAAWAAACKIEASMIIVPAEYEFLVGPISFSGPYCQANIVFQVNSKTQYKISLPLRSNFIGLPFWIQIFGGYEHEGSLIPCLRPLMHWKERLCCPISCLLDCILSI